MASRPVTAVLAPLLLLPVVGLIIAAYYPGHIILDGLWLLEQARADRYTDMQPPILAWLWRPLDQVWPGSGPILILNQICFTTGIYLVLRSFYRPLVAAPATAVLIVAPPLLGVSGMIVKDAVLLSAFTLAIGLMMRAESAACRPWAKLLLLSLTVPLLLLVHVARVNSLPLTVFTGYALLRLVGRTVRPGPWRRPVMAHLAMFSAAFAFFATVEVGVRVFNAQVLAAEETFPYRKIMIYDLVAMSLEEGVVLLDQTHFPSQQLSNLRDHFHLDTVDTVIAHGIEPAKVQDSADPAHVRALTGQWMRAIRDHPGSYLTVRLMLFSRLLGLGPWVCAPFFHKIDENDFGLAIRNEELNSLLVSYLSYFQSTLLNQPWVYLVLIVVSSVALARRNARGDRTLAIIGVGAVFYALPYFVIAPSCEYRYVAPLVLTSILVTAAWARSASTPSPACPPTPSIPT